jgi:hypothetical protein
LLVLASGNVTKVGLLQVYPLTWEVMIDNVYLDDEKLPQSTMVSSSIGPSALIDTVSSFSVLF